MPRPNRPASLLAPKVPPFVLGDSEAKDIARVLGLQRLSPEIAGSIAETIAAYKATETGSVETTVGNTVAALNELNKKGRRYEQAVARIADERSGIDYMTWEILQPLARAVRENMLGAREALAQAACLRVEELRRHKRVDPKTEALRFFCGVIRLLFNVASAPTLRNTSDEGWYHCRRFAMEVFAVAGICTPSPGAADRISRNGRAVG
jgi:hypothetical protein